VCERERERGRERERERERVLYFTGLKLSTMIEITLCCMIRQLLVTCVY
jgi:hypothetical protein